MFIAQKLSLPPRVRPEKGRDLDRGVHDSALGVSIGVPICVPSDLTLERARAAFLEKARDARLHGEEEGRGGGGALGGVGVGLGGVEWGGWRLQDMIFLGVFPPGVGLCHLLLRYSWEMSENLLLGVLVTTWMKEKEEEEEEEEEEEMVVSLIEWWQISIKS